jgi:quinol monooxygenase YgiN
MIVCVNTYEVPSQQVDAFVQAFSQVLDLLKQKPGFIRVRLHRANDDSDQLMTYAEWDSLDDQRAAGQDPGLVPRMKAVLAIARPKAQWFDVLLDERGRVKDPT